MRCGNSYSDQPHAGCTVLVSPSRSGTSPNSRALSVFHIDGVRLGMTPDQAVAAIATHFGVPDAAIRHVTTPMGSLGTTAVVSYIRNAQPSRAIGVHFGIDPATRTLRAETVIAGEPSSAPGRRAMYAATVARYGPPSADVVAGQFDLWCEKSGRTQYPLTGPTCLPGTPQLFLFNGGFGAPFATLTQGGLFMPTWDTIALTTTAWATARLAAAQHPAASP